MFSSCSSQGHRGTSSNLKDAKQRGIFIKEYYSPNESIVINDTIQFEIEEAWLEYQWRQSYGSEKYTAKYDAYQIRINTSKELPKRVDFAWSIGSDFAGLTLRQCNDNCLIGDFKEIPNDTIIYPVIKGRLLKNDTLIEERILGMFTLIAK